MSKLPSTISIVLMLTSSAFADFGDPLPGLTAAQTQLFLQGQAAFAEEENVAEGLGPVFNDNACVACHTGPSTAIGGSNGRLETRFGKVTGTNFDPLLSLGGSLVQENGIKRGDSSAGLPAVAACGVPFQFKGEKVPSAATVSAQRRTTNLFGLGFVDTLTDSQLDALAAQEAKTNPATAGTVSRVIDPDTTRPAVGRFGWKAQVPTLHAFAGDAYLNEMGITNPSFPDESCPQGDCAQLVCNPVPGLNDDGGDVTNFANFMTLLAAPPRGPIDSHVSAGEKVFSKIGCAQCHTPDLTSGPSPIAALDHKHFAPYSDFLLHDMGSLGDGIAQGAANTRMMRTAPLWGLRTVKKFLHDGRNASLQNAIAAHDGQGAAARTAFQGLSNTDRADLLSFLGSL
jgi:CxxC motif-containing protein (DUF1111 family)